VRSRTDRDERGVDDDGFVAAFDDLYPMAVRLAIRIVGDQPTAEDVAAEALTRTYARWSRVVTLPYRDAWVLRVTGNLAIDTIRRRRRTPPPPLAHHFDDGVDLRIALASAMARLPSRQREALVLRYLAGYTEAEVSSALGISPNSVKTHVQRGLAALRRRLDDNDGTDIALV
jgi:RNA polymerase sigma factor (sigma-70 family)